MTSEQTEKRPKSPPAPSRSLRDCIQDVQRLHNMYGGAAFSKSEIASALNLSASSGAFTPRLFTLKEFGLIDPMGDKYKVSELFLQMNSSQPYSATFKQRALDSVRRAQVFGDLLNEFTTKLPSQATIARRLETQKKFNPEKAKVAANVLENSLRFAGVLDGSNNILPVRDDQSLHETQQPSDEQRTTSSERGGANSDELYSESEYSGYLKLELPLKEGRRVLVLYPPDLSGPEANKVSKVLQAVASSSFDSEEI